MSSGHQQPVGPMEAEFGVVAAWTEQAVEELGVEFAIPAGCRGTGSPSAFAWLAEALETDADTTFLDSGAGVGGPAAWLHEHYGTRPVLAEPMSAAAGASARLFGLPAVVAWSESLPFRDGTFDAAWSLGVLCTVPDKRAFLAETRRVLGPRGALGLLVYVRSTDELPEQPEGNDFPTEEELADDLTTCGFSVVQQVDATSLGRAPQAWQDKLDRVEEVVRER